MLGKLTGKDGRTKNNKQLGEGGKAQKKLSGKELDNSAKREELRRN